MKERLDLNLLKVFIEVYRLNSITLAAEALDSTQPAVSGILKRLSAQLGEQLFTREGRGISPTNIAIQLASEIAPHLTAIDNSIANLKTFDIQHNHKFKVSVSEPMMLLLQPLINEVASLGNCHIELMIAPSTQESLLEQLSLQQIDLAIDLGRTKHPSYLNKPFHRDRLLLSCSKQHKEIKGEITIEQFYKSQHVGIKMRRDGLHAIQELAKVPIEERTVTSFRS